MNDETKTDADRTKKSATWEEAMRLIELVLKEQYVSITVLERKAALLITFCVAIIGYLVSAKFDGIQTFCSCDGNAGNIILLVLKSIGIIFLMMAIGLGVRIFEPGNFAVGGISPEKALDCGRCNDYDKFVEKYIEDTQNNYEKNEKAMKKKSNRLKTAYIFLIIGLSLSALLALGDEIVPILF